MPVFKLCWLGHFRAFMLCWLAHSIVFMLCWLGLGHSWVFVLRWLGHSWYFMLRWLGHSLRFSCYVDMDTWVFTLCWLGHSWVFMLRWLGNLNFHVMLIWLLLRFQSAHSWTVYYTITVCLFSDIRAYFVLYNLYIPGLYNLYNLDCLICSFVDCSNWNVHFSIV